MLTDHVVVFYQVYIIKQSIRRFATYVTLPWPNSELPPNTINSHVFLIGSGIILLPFFIVISLIKVGNYSNDGRKLGSFVFGRKVNNDLESCGSKRKHWMQLLWKHMFPVAPMIHLAIACCFAFLRILTEAQLIRYGFLNKSDIWKTDLDFMLAKYNGHQYNFFGLLRTIELNEHKAIFGESASLGQLFIRNSKTLSESFYELNQSGKISIEFFNFMFALIILTVRYSSVFWRTNKLFSLIFSGQLLMNLIQSVLMFGAFQIAFKIFVCDPSHLLIRYRESSSLSLFQLCTIFFVYLVVLHSSSLSVYVYGIQKYHEYRYARTIRMQSKYQNSQYTSFAPYLMAMVFFFFIALLIGPLFYEHVIIYCGSLNINSLLVIFSTILYFSFWIILWVFLANKNSWTFVYDDKESDEFMVTFNSEPSSMIIMSQGKTLRVYEDAAKQAILNFAQSKVAEQSKHLSRSKSILGSKNDKMSRFNKNTRYSTRSYSNHINKRCDTSRITSDMSDSESEYITFRRSHSFNHKNMANLSQVQQPNEDAYGILTFTHPSQKATQPKMTQNSAYQVYNHEVPKHQFHNDRTSETSSGIHSTSSLDSSERPMVKSNSLESLMQRLEVAAAERPQIRTNTTTTFQPKESRVKLTNYHHNDSLPFESSKLIEFTENNADYSKYYSLTDNYAV